MKTKSDKVSLYIPVLVIALSALTLAACSHPPATKDISGPAQAGEPASGVSALTAKELSIKPYPLDLCIVSDEELDSMGGPITKIYKGQELKFCCKGCVRDFNENPAEYLAKLNE